MAKRSAVRNFLMHGFHLLVMVVVGNQIRDTQCGFKVRARVRAQQRAGYSAGRTSGCCAAHRWRSWLQVSGLPGAAPTAAAPLQPFFSPLADRPRPQLFTRAAAQQIYSNQRLQRWCFDVEDVYLAQRLKAGRRGSRGAGGRAAQPTPHREGGGWHVEDACLPAGHARALPCPTAVPPPPPPPPPPQIPMSEVQVHWTEIPGSKIRPSSMAHMALELALLKAGYSGA